MSETFSFTDTRSSSRSSGRSPGRSSVFSRSSRGSAPLVKLFETVKNTALGKKYDLSLAFVSKPEIRQINRIYRGEDKATNILSLPLDTKNGEIFICPSVVDPEDLLSLFIHGLIHLKGFDHGSKMEREERQIRKKFYVR